MQVFGDRYESTGELGRGGMATVYRAHDRRHNREVAVKPLLAELEKRAKTEPISSSAVATLHLYLGDQPAFFRWLTRAHDEREPFALALHLERLWEPAWREPEYQKMVGRVGLSG